MCRDALQNKGWKRGLPLKAIDRIQGKEMLQLPTKNNSASSHVAKP